MTSYWFYKSASFGRSLFRGERVCQSNFYTHSDIQVLVGVSVVFVRCISMLEFSGTYWYIVCGGYIISLFHERGLSVASVLQPTGNPTVGSFQELLEHRPCFIDFVSQKLCHINIIRSFVYTSIYISLFISLVIRLATE